MKHTHTPAAAFAGRRTRPEPRHAVPVFRDEGQPLILSEADEAASPELEPAADAFGRSVGFLTVDAAEGAGDKRPTHAPLTAANLEAELAPLGIYRTADGRLVAYCRLASLAGARLESPGVGVYFELNPAAPLGAVWDALFRPAFPAGEG